MIEVLKAHEIIVRCKYHLKQINKTRGKNVATNENCILRKIREKSKPLFQTFLQNTLPEQAEVAK